MAERGKLSAEHASGMHADHLVRPARFEMVGRSLCWAFQVLLFI
jgi:hypothetical protein